MHAAGAVRLACALLYCAGTAQAARLLAVLPTNTRSHYAMYGRLLGALAQRHHHVTIISHFAMKNAPPNVDEISLAGTIPEITNNLTAPRTLRPQLMSNLDQIMDECVEACEGLTRVEAVRALLNSTTRFDLVIVEVFGTDCALGFAHRFGAPVVGLLSSVPLPWVNDHLGNPDHPAYLPAYMMGLGQRMTLWERFLNTFAIVYAKVAYRLKSQIPSQMVAERLFGTMPPLEQLARNYSLVLSNSHFSINDVRPLVPALVEVGGLHLDSSQQLPKDLKQILDSSPAGVIYWSFGSISRIETIPIETLEQIFEVFGQLPQRIIIKMNRSALPENVTVPENVHTQTWLPQYKTLCHPSVRVFVSHGGLLGTQEAVACGVPMLVVPLYADQALNARAASDRGAARVLPLHAITARAWRDAIVDLLDNPTYKKNAERLSEVFLDRPSPPLETGVYWVEYVLRHRGASHLRSPALALPLHQYLLLDVLALSITIVLTLVYLLNLLARAIFKLSVKWWPLDKLVFDEDSFKQISLASYMLRSVVCKVKTN